MRLSRRNFLTLTGLSATGILLASPLKNFYTKLATGKSISTQGFGELIPDSNKLLDLPKGFQYRIFSKVGDTMSDGNPVPMNHDGMAAFDGGDGTTILVRNHEVNPFQTPAVIASEDKKFDRLSPGGTTTLIVDQDRRLVKDYVSLAGTSRNCAGGATPWGSWISCEEHTITPMEIPPNTPVYVSRKHGYNFEVPSKGGLADPIPLVAMGRFNHEAIAVDPKTGYIYQTEDRKNSAIYRFRPHEYGNLKGGGILEALKIKEMSQVNTSINFPIGEPKPVEWVKIENVDPDNDSVRYEAFSKGAAIFKRGEGACYGNNEIYWTCTSGGEAGYGQVFRYDPIANTVELFVESKGQGQLDYPDNITFTPFGHLMLCEDGADEQFIVGVNQAGELYKFARNAINNKEFAGACFSPDGQTMFVNIQNPGITFAIWGPWDKIGA